MTSTSAQSLSKQESNDAFGPTLVVEDTTSSTSHQHHPNNVSTTTASGKDISKLESENQQLLREVLTCRKNLDIAQQNVSTLKALCNQLAQQLNSANSEISILRENRGSSDNKTLRETETRISVIREGYEKQLSEMRKELENQNEIYTQLATESQDSHRKADKSFKDIIATKDGLIAELTRTVECLQAGMRNHHQQHQNHNHHNHHSSSSLNQSFNRQHQQNQKSFGGTRLSSPTRRNNNSLISSQDAVSVRNAIVEPTIDLLRLSLRAMKDDVSKRHTPLGEVNSVFYSSQKKPMTRYFVDVQADKHRLDEVPLVDLMIGGGSSSSNNNDIIRSQMGAANTGGTWPKSWKFHTPQGELITLSLDVESL